MEIVSLSEKLKNLKEAYVILSGFQPGDPSFIQKKQHITSELKEIQRQLSKAKIVLKTSKERLEKDKILLDKLQEMDKYIDYVENNIPADLIAKEPLKDVKNKQILKPNNGMTIEQLSCLQISSTVSPCPSDWSTILATPCVTTNHSLPKPDLSTIIDIPHVTSSELNSVPSYMRGRITVAAVNSCINAFNTALNKKYAIMRQKRKELKPRELDMYTAWKAQDDIKKDKWYCTPDDLINLSGFKMDKSAYSIITILRHLKRIQEVKIQGKKSRYIVQSH